MARYNVFRVGLLMRPALAVLAWLVAAAASAQPLDLCAGRVTDKLNHPLGAILDPTTLRPIEGRPVQGQTYVDAAFGTYITVVAMPKPGLGELAVIKPMYSTTRAWNKGQKLLMLYDREVGHVLYLGDEPYTRLRVLPIRPTDYEHVLWDPVEANVFYYTTTKNQQRNQLIKATLGPAPGYELAEQVLYDFSNPPTNCPTSAPFNRFGLGADPEAALAEHRVFGLMCGSKGDTKITYSIPENRVLHHVTLAPLKPGQPERAQIAGTVAPSGQRQYYGGGYVLNLDFSPLLTLVAKKFFEHSMVGSSPAWGDVWNAVAFEDSTPGANDSGVLVTHRLQTGERKVIIGPATGFPYIGAGTHISATGPSGWVAVSTVGGAHTGLFPGDNELRVANVDTGKVCRVAHVRTWAGTDCGPLGNQCPWGYFGEPHPTMGEDGRILWASDWMGSPSGVATLLYDPRKPPVKMRCTSTCDVLSFNPTTPACKTDSCERLP